VPRLNPDLNNARRLTDARSHLIHDWGRNKNCSQTMGWMAPAPDGAMMSTVWMAPALGLVGIALAAAVECTRVSGLFMQSALTAGLEGFRRTKPPIV
jgi:hypothetical protein